MIKRETQSIHYLDETLKEAKRLLLNFHSDKLLVLNKFSVRNANPSSNLNITFVRGILQRYLRKESVDDLDEMEGIENDGNDGVNGNKTEGPLANDDIYSNQTGK